MHLGRQRRVVEYEMAVGKALASDDDPDYDVVDNKLYHGRDKGLNVRPYPLPSSAKVSS